MITKKCHLFSLVAPVCDQPFDDVPIPVLSEIQTISTTMPVSNSRIVHELVEPVHI